MIKSFTILMVLGGFCLNGFGQKLNDSQVPAAVKATFTKNYPGVIASWENEKGNYEAGFKKNGRAISALFEPGGTFLESEIVIKESELPAPARTYLEANYKNKKVKGYSKTTKADGTMTYEAEVDNMDLSFDSNGHLLGKE
jgi:Putative beta-lactamase-inhibitor-like, PepSY-like